MPVLTNIPEAVSQLIKEVEALKETVSPSNASIVHKFEGSEILTIEIYDSIKAGDQIAIFPEVYTVMSKVSSPAAIVANCLYSVAADSVVVKKLVWATGSAPSYTTATISI